MNNPHRPEKTPNADDPVLALLEQMREVNDRQVAEALGRSDAEHQASRATLDNRAADADTRQGTELPPFELPESIGRFQISRVLGQGGYGLVLLALDPTLKRQVALKIPRSIILLTEELQLRFVREAEAAAALNHAHIVPVYEVGRSGPICYLAAAYCDGESLAERLLRIGRFEPRAAAQLTAILAEAMQHAHNRGVLHRDLKPANILLTRDPAADSQQAVEAAEVNWPMITDFGLARLEDEDERVTATGSILGTPAYMAPEQAAGDRSAAGAAADIYSLGAILYELLTGARPFAEPTLLATLDAVRHRDPAPLRRLQHAVPRDLEAIALKCLEKSPAARYSTCSELEADLERFLAGETVHARSVTGYERAIRWCRRKPLQAALIAALFVGLVTVATVSTVAYRQVSRARDAEARRLSQLRVALEAQVSVVLEDLLSRQQELTQDHQAYLEAALDAYQQLAADEKHDPASRAGVAQAYARVGDIRARLGDSEGAVSAYEQSIARYRQLAGDFPEQSQHRFDQACVQSTLTMLLKDLDRLDEAEQLGNDALEIVGHLNSENPDNPDYLHRLSTLHGALGMIYRRTSRSEDSERAYRHAVELHATLVQQFPDHREYRDALAKSYGNLAMLMWQQRRLDGVAPLIEKAKKIHRDLSEEFPDNTTYRESLARHANVMGAIAMTTGDVPHAEAAFDEQLAIYRGLATDFPANKSYQTGLIEAYNNLGVVMIGTDRAERATECWRSAAGVARRFIREFTDVPDDHARLAALLLHLAQVTLDNDNPTEAYDLATEGQQHLDVALQSNASNPNWLRYLAESHVAHANIFAALGRHVEAAEAAERSLEMPFDPVKSPLDAARVLAKCGALAEQDETLSSAQRQELVKNYAERAISGLNAAAAAGFDNLEELESDIDLQRLATRDDFQRVLDAMKSEK